MSCIIIKKEFSPVAGGFNYLYLCDSTSDLPTKPGDALSCKAEIAGGKSYTMSPAGSWVVDIRNPPYDNALTVTQAATTTLTVELYRTDYIVPAEAGCDAYATGDRVKPGTVLQITCVGGTVKANGVAVTLTDTVGYYTVGNEDVAIVSTAA